MTDLERALRDTLADPPVQVPATRYAEYDIERRIERRRGRQKRTAAGLGVAAVIAAAIAVPVATGVDLGSGGSRSAGSGANGSANLDAQRGGANGGSVPQPQRAAPAPVRSAARELVRDHGSPPQTVEWVQTTASAWGRLRHTTIDASATGPVYVLQIRDFRCVQRCPADLQSTGPRAALVMAVHADGDREPARFQRPIALATLGPVHTFTVR